MPLSAAVCSASCMNHVSNDLCRSLCAGHSCVHMYKSVWVWPLLVVSTAWALMLCKCKALHEALTFSTSLNICRHHLEQQITPEGVLKDVFQCLLTCMRCILMSSHDMPLNVF